MIADVNDEKVAAAAAKDETLSQIRTEIYNMAQKKEVQGMLIREKYERMNWESYGNDREAEGEERGRAEGRKEGRAEGRKEGRAEGRKEGRTEGENKLGSLVSKLLSSGRTEDAMKASNDAQYREKLYIEFGINDIVSGEE